MGYSETKGLNLETLKQIVEGNHVSTWDFAESLNPVLAISSSVSHRKDYDGVLSLLNNLKKRLTKDSSNRISLNIINNSINEAGANYLNNFKSISESDFSNSCGLYFLNTNPNSSNLKKI